MISWNEKIVDGCKVLMGNRVQYEIRELHDSSDYELSIFGNFQANADNIQELKDLAEFYHKHN